MSRFWAAPSGRGSILALPLLRSMTFKFLNRSEPHFSRYEMGKGADRPAEREARGALRTCGPAGQGPSSARAPGRQGPRGGGGGGRGGADHAPGREGRCWPAALAAALSAARRRESRRYGDRAAGTREGSARWGGALREGGESARSPPGPPVPRDIRVCTDWARRSPAAAPTPLRPEVERGGRSAEARPAPEPSERPRMAGVPGYRGGRGRWARGGARVPLRPRPPGCIGRAAPRCLGARTGPRRPGFAAALAPGPGGTAAGRAVGSGRLEGRLPGPEMLRLWTRRRGEGPSRWRGPPAGERGRRASALPPGIRIRR